MFQQLENINKFNLFCVVFFLLFSRYELKTLNLWHDMVVVIFHCQQQASLALFRCRHNGAWEYVECIYSYVYMENNFLTLPKDSIKMFRQPVQLDERLRDGHCVETEVQVQGLSKKIYNILRDIVKMSHRKFMFDLSERVTNLQHMFRYCR